MASNAKFEIEIYGNTAKFENSLRGINTAMSGLKGEASALKKALQLDPSNTDKMAQLQKNLQKQLELSRNKANQLKQDLANVDKSTPEGQKKWIKLTRDLANTEIQASKLENEIKDVDNAISAGKWDVKAKVDLEDGAVNSKIDGFKSKFNGLKEIAVGAFRQIGASAVNALGNGLKGWVTDAMDTQKAMISLKNTMQFKGNAAEFNTVSTSMSKLAKDTNANTEDTLKLATTFIGLGDNAKTAVSKTEALVKANQAFGGTGEQLKGVTQAYGQMSAAGKVSAENINQLTDNNTALGSALKSTVMEMNPTLKQYGSFAAASEKGAISVEMLDKAMQKLGEAGGGSVTTIGDAWDSFNETLSLALLPTLDALTPVITALIDKMSGWGEVAGNAISGIVQYVQLLWYQLQDNGAIESFAGVWNNIKVIFRVVIGIIGQLVQAFFKVDEASLKNKTSMEQVAATIKAIGDALLTATARIAVFLAKLSQNQAAMDALKIAVAALAGALGAFKAIKTIINVVNAFKLMFGAVQKVFGAVKLLFGLIMANPFVAIAVAIAAVVAGLVYFFTQTEKGKKIWADFVDYLKSAVESIKKFFSGLGTWFSNLWKGIVNTTKGIGKGIADSWNESVESIKAIWNGLTSFFTTLVEGIKTIWSGITEFFVSLWNGIIGVVQTVFTTISSIVTTAYNWFVTTFQPLISFYQSIFNLILSVINLAFQAILAVVRGAYQLVIGAWQGLSAWFSGIFNVVSNVVSNAFNAIVSFAKTAWNGLVSVWNAVAGFFSGVFNAVRNVVSNAFSAIGSFAQSAWSRVVSIWNAVVGFYMGIFNGVRNTVSSAFSAIGSFASSAYSRVISAFQPVVSFFSGLFNGVRNTVSGVFNTFGSIASNAVRAITGAFSGLANFFSGLFNGIRSMIDNALGGVTGIIDNISGAINGIAGKLGGLFKGSTVIPLSEVNLAASGSGLSTNSASSDNRTYNTFNVTGGAGQDVSALARAIRREFDTGRA